MNSFFILKTNSVLSKFSEIMKLFLTLSRLRWTPGFVVSPGRRNEGSLAIRRCSRLEPIAPLYSLIDWKLYFLYIVRLFLKSGREKC